VHVCLLVAVVHAGCWLVAAAVVVVVAAVGVICAGTTWGTLKSMKIDQVQKIHAPKFLVCVFVEVAEEPQAAQTQHTQGWDVILVGAHTS